MSPRTERRAHGITEYLVADARNQRRSRVAAHLLVGGRSERAAGGRGLLPGADPAGPGPCLRGAACPGSGQGCVDLLGGWWLIPIAINNLPDSTPLTGYQSTKPSVTHKLEQGEEPWMVEREIPCGSYAEIWQLDDHMERNQENQETLLKHVAFTDQGTMTEEKSNKCIKA
ncbi:uncharacterized protein AAEQ78_007026 [Lycaon pictus]